MVIKIHNTDKLIKKLGDISNIDLTPAISLVTRKVQQTARDLAPVDKGPLRESIKQKVEKAGKSVVGTVFTPLEYAVYREFGTRAHTIYPVKAKALAWKGSNGKTIFAKKVNIPASKPTPFMRPALELNRKIINNDIKKYVEQQIKLKGKI